MSDKFIDIKPIVSISDYSLYILLFTLLIGALIAYKLYKLFYEIGQKSCKVDCQKYYFDMYCSADWSKPKEAAYIATKYGEVLAQDRRRRELFSQLKGYLDNYKYKRDVSKVDEQTLNYYNLYKQVCDESL